MPASASSLPSPLALNALDYARACNAAGLPGIGGHLALDRYSKFYREGLRTDPLIPGGLLPPVGRIATSEGPEGAAVKFTLVVSRPASGRDGAAIGNGQSAIDAAYPPPASSRLPIASAPIEIESVLIPMIGKKRTRSYTLCVSSQVGCAMGCTFCQTAQMGLIRSLSAAEIVAQWYTARHIIARPDPDAPITNIVFMGMGEPMDNLDEVVRAIDILTDRRGPAVAMRKITVSTVGRIDGIARLAERVRVPGWHRLGLAVSLNSPNDATRSGIMPINRSTPMAALREALCAWPLYAGAHLCIEYVLIPGVTDSEDAPEQLASFMLGSAYPSAPLPLGGAGGGSCIPPCVPSCLGASVPSGLPLYPGPPLQALVNVIPYNPRDNSPWPAPTEESVEAFVAKLSSLGVYVKRRRTKGRDTMAACGQLGNPEMRRRRAPAAA
ncbi:MAG: 23S rRNA (adenine(2503)-C(2))-methyltransferase RlmN [Phycisphaerales bacterium]